MKDKYVMCEMYMNKLVEVLADSHVPMKSCNYSSKDHTMYLVPIGTEDKVTYYSKPAYSFRYSDHWNWYANLDKCEKETTIQCFTKDLPYAKRRKKPGLASSPIYAISVMMADKTGAYHCIYGEVYDRKTRTWDWKVTPIDEVVKMVNEKRVC